MTRLTRAVAPMLLATLSASAQAANDADLAAIRDQIETLKHSYEQRIAALEARLAQAETKAAAPAPLPADTGSASTYAAASNPAMLHAGPAPANGFNPEISLTLQGRYKNMKDVAERRISGFASASHDHATNGVEGFSRRGFSVDHTELSLAANIDPYWRGQAIFAVLDGETEVEEAWFQSLGLDHGLGLKAGRYLSGIGYLNEKHPHAWDFADAPLMYQALFGEHGSYAQDGLQVKWLAPTPVFLEFGAEIGRGANFPGSDRNSNDGGSHALFAHVGDDLGDSHSWRAGLSYLRTRARERESHFEDLNGMEAQGAFTGKSTTWIADFVWKWAPDGNPKYRNFTFQSEYFLRREQGDLSCRDEEGIGNLCAGDMTGDYHTRQSGAYVQGVYQFTPNWRAGLRYERLDSGNQDLGANNATLTIDHYRPRRATAMVDYSWSEFSRMRLQYAQDKSMRGLTDNQITLQYIMSLGAHGAHKF
ncbi:MAG: TonB-dependent receptor [Azovibrio sp.]|uniref:TonB-dependent receptor n=1 Tax=Azovibrio sp. TaxID=1872673 RepID=UPI003C77D525